MDENENSLTIFSRGSQKGQIKDRLQPYEEDECRHDRRFDRHGVLTCMDCTATYNEKTCEWENGHCED